MLPRLPGVKQTHPLSSDRRPVLAAGAHPGRALGLVTLYGMVAVGLILTSGELHLRRRKSPNWGDGSASGDVLLPRLAERQEVAPPALVTRRGVERAGDHLPEGGHDPLARLGRIAGRTADLLAVTQVEVGEGEVLPRLPPHLGGRQRVQVQLEPGQLVVGRLSAGLVVDDLP